MQQKEDIRLVSTVGGYEGIASLIGCGGSHKAIGTVKALLHAQAYARFSFCDKSQGNLIILREMERHRNGEPSKINVILGESLLPNYTHLLPKGEKRRLIPIPILPPMIGSRNIHAAQAFLQLLLLEEFSDQSRRSVETGSVYLPQEKWIELGKEARLPISSLPKILEGWLEQAFLERDSVHKDAYTLGKDYFHLTDFLREQGECRKERSRTAKMGKRNYARLSRGIV